MLTTGNDTVTGSTATIAAADVIVDSSTTDADVANFAVTAAALALRVNSVETINYNGDFATTGADLTNVFGAKEVNFNTAISGGTATVTLASAAQTKLVAGASIGNFTATTLATGTAGTLTVDLGAVTAVATITGSGVNDTYVVNNPMAASTLGLTGGDGTDSFTVNFSKGGVVTLTTATAENLILNSTTAAQTVLIGNAAGVTLVNGANTGTTGPKAVVNATTDFTLRSQDLNNVEGLRIEKSGAGVFTLRGDGDVTTAGAVLNGIAANIFDVRGALGDAAYTVNENTTVKLNVVDGFVTNTVLNISNIDGTLVVPGTLKLDLAFGNTAAIAFGDRVSTVALTATTANLTAVGNVIAELNINTGAVTTATLAGDKNVTITLLTATANDVFSASGLTGNLTIAGTTAGNAVTIVGGSGVDTITLGTGGGLVVSNAGNDVITSLTGNTTVNGGDGTDAITTGDGADSIDGGAGVDNLIAGAANDTVIGGAGVDTVNGGVGSDVLTGGTDGDQFVFAAAGTVNETGGVPSGTVFDSITDWTAGDKIDSGTVLFTQATAAAAISGTANISSAGLATFNAADNTFALKLTAVARAIEAGTSVAGEAAVFTDGGNTFLFIADGVEADPATPTTADHFIRLVGVNATTGITIDSAGDITGIV